MWSGAHECGEPGCTFPPPLPVRNKLYSDSQGGQYLSLELNAITLFSVSFV